MPRIFGLQISRVSKPAKKKPESTLKFYPTAEEKHLWLKRLGIKTVLDVGAHEGRTAIQFLELFPGAQIYSFEPIAACYNKLVEKTQGNTRCKTYNVAVGEKEGVIEFHESAYSPSSSVLPMAHAHEEAFPFTKGGRTTEVKLITLNGFIEQQQLVGPIAVKIDVQGYEWQVLCGARKVYPHIHMFIVETSFTELYKGQKQFADIYSELTSNGFAYSGSFDQLFNPSDGMVIQQDAIFIKLEK